MIQVMKVASDWAGLNSFSMAHHKAEQLGCPSRIMRALLASTVVMSPTQAMIPTLIDLVSVG